MAEPDDPRDRRRAAATRALARHHDEAGWRVWADVDGWRRPDPVPGERYRYVPAIYAEHGRLRRLVSVAPLGGCGEPARRRALAAAARGWAPHGSYVRLVATSTGTPAAARHAVEPPESLEEDPLRDVAERPLGGLPSEPSRSLL